MNLNIHRVENIQVETINELGGDTFTRNIIISTEDQGDFEITLFCLSRHAATLDIIQESEYAE